MTLLVCHAYGPCTVLHPHNYFMVLLTNYKVSKYKLKVCFHIAQYPVHWTAQSALHFTPWQTCSFRHQLGFSGKHSSHAAITRNDYSLTCPPLSIAKYSFIQLSRLRHREENENAQTSKRYQRGFEPGLSRLRVRHSTTELPRSTKDETIGLITKK